MFYAFRESSIENKNSGIFGEIRFSQEQLQNIQPYNNETDPSALTSPLLNWSIRDGTLSLEVYIYHKALTRPSKEEWQKNGIICSFHEVEDFDVLAYAIPLNQTKEFRIISKESSFYDTVPKDYSIEIDLSNEDKIIINSSLYCDEPDFWCYNHRIECILKDV